MGDKIQIAGFIGLLIFGSSLDSAGWFLGLVLVLISIFVMEIGYRLNKLEERRTRRNEKIQAINKRRQNDLVKEWVSSVRLYDTQRRQQVHTLHTEEQ